MGTHFDYIIVAIVLILYRPHIPYGLAGMVIIAPCSPVLVEIADLFDRRGDHLQFFRKSSRVKEA